LVAIEARCGLPTPRGRSDGTETGSLLHDLVQLCENVLSRHCLNGTRVEFLDTTPHLLLPRQLVLRLVLERSNERLGKPCTLITRQIARLALKLFSRNTLESVERTVAWLQKEGLV